MHNKAMQRSRKRYAVFVHSRCSLLHKKQLRFCVPLIAALGFTANRPCKS